MDLKEILSDDGMFLNLVCLLIVIGFIVVAAIKAFRGDDDLDL